MDNEYTRKEEKCPVMDEYCNVEHKNCYICINEVLESNDELFKQEELERQKEYEHEMETLLWEKGFKQEY